MIIDVRIKNFFSISDEVSLSTRADMRIKRFPDNVSRIAGYDIVKALALYGPNNAGKTNILRALLAIVNTLLRKPFAVNRNIFTDDPVCSLGVSFTFEKRIFSYDMRFSCLNGKFVYEKFAELSADEYGNESAHEIFVRDSVGGLYCFNENKELSDLLGSVSDDNILIYTANTAKYPELEECKRILTGFAESVTVIDMNEPPVDLALEIAKNGPADPRSVLMTKLIKSADLEIDDFKYVKRDVTFRSPQPIRESMYDGAVRAAADLLGLTSVHNGKELPSLSYDSTGTKKMISAASYIADALVRKKTLIIDEIDSSLHFKLTRGIVALFDNDVNKYAQLIFTTHDATLLDCKKLFRKDQIWFAAKENDAVELYSLADFTAERNGVRSDSDMIELYKRGVLGALPDPDLFSALADTEVSNE